MMRSISFLLLVGLFVGTVGCQNGAEDTAEPAAADTMATDADTSADMASTDDWAVRFDDAEATRDQVEFTMADGGYEITSGPAAIYYDPADSVSAPFELSATFNQLAETDHPEAYGLFFGGTDLQADGQAYTYFLIRQTGEYLLKARTGSDTSTLQDWTSSEALETVGSEGTASNTLTVQVTADSVRFMANGTRLASMAASEVSAMNGIAGLRVNHNLNVRVEDFTVQESM